MIPNQWYAILESNEVRQGHPIGTTRMGEKMVVWRDSAGQVTVMSDQCPHRGAALSIGKVVNDCIQCPFHGFEYDPLGDCRFIPANGKNSTPPKAMHVRTYPTREAHGFIYIWWGAPRKNEDYPPLQWFENIGADMVYSTIRSHWKNHYSRAIENQLDVVHLPFVHYNTIGSGHRTLVNGPYVAETQLATGSYRLDLWVNNETDHGQKPIKPAEMPKPQHRPLIQFYFPNMWQNWLSNDFLVFLVFAPIDEQNTMLYLRQYHKVRIPVARQLTEWFGALGNSYILNQDKRVVITQRPERADLDIGETLISGDHPIILYRKRRRALIDSVCREH